MARQGKQVESIDRSRIAGAYVVRRFVRDVFVPTVEIELTSGDLVSFAVESEEDAHQTVRSFGFGAKQRRVHLGLASPARRLLHLPLGIAAYYIGSAASLPVLFLSDGYGPPP